MAGMGRVADETAKAPMESPLRREPNRAAQLHVVFPPALRTTAPLGLGDRVLGRQPADEGLSLADATVSRRHLRIRASDDGHVVCDLGSQNGSRVMGAPVGEQDVPLAPGAVIRVGDVLLVYERGAGVGAPDAPEVSQDAIPGVSAAAVRLRARVAAAAIDPSPVLLVGETGTGKEFIAREMHRLSERRGPMLAVNCGALTAQLIESQLFGHTRGAFTGADQDHDGLFRAADGGTLLLDEVGELSPAMQTKLLRVLQEGEVLPVGRTHPIAVDTRVVAATLRDLPRLAKEGGFRDDLYARLSPWEIVVPPLRDRRADLLAWLARLDAGWLARRERAPEPLTMDANAAERLLLHPWPHNLRGLERLVHHVRSTDGVFDLPHGWEAPDPDSPPLSAPPPRAPSEDDAPRSRRPRRPRPSKEELEAALARHDGSVRAVARELERDRRMVYRWMELYGLR